jgi:nucleoside-diphosphate-sugar epimerase
VNPGKYRYGLNKKIAEDLILDSRIRTGLNVVALRICTVVGPLYSRPRSVVSILIRMPVLPASFSTTRVQFMHEDDFAEMIRKVLEDDDMEGLFNLAPDSCTVVGDVVPAARFRRFPCSVLKPVMWLLWNLRLANLQPAGFGYCLYPVVMDSSKLAGRLGYHFRYTSSEAFLSAREKNNLPPGARF